MKEELEVNKIFIFAQNLILAMCLTIVMIFILSIIISFTEVDENVIFPCTIFISALSIMIGGFFVSKKMKEKGIVYGAIFGMLYMLILYLLSSIINCDFSLNLSSLIMIGFGIVGGSVGGIIGVNL